MDNNSVGIYNGITYRYLSNTPGVSSSSLTLIAALQPYILRAFVSHDNADDLQPSITILGFGRYVWYSLILTFIYCLVFFYFRYVLVSLIFLVWLQCVIGSTILTLFFILVIEHVRSRA